MDVEEYVFLDSSRMDLAGRYVTPVVSSGLLAGTMRRKLLADHDVPVYEEVLTLADLERAEAVFCCNSVRGVIQVQVEWRNYD